MLLYLLSRFKISLEYLRHCLKKKKGKEIYLKLPSSTHTRNSHISKNAIPSFYSLNVKRFAKITLFGLQVRFSAEEQVAWFWESKVTER